ncbi:MAG: DegT/DnrJ/EryC1/StrS family aminotransferase [Deltaproteobacteria bacterium]|nr:MAG: DegT/DnrJ/EryC1/StrS family aminotransferase [Deltaproteobacteria bacterium]
MIQGATNTPKKIRLSKSCLSIAEKQAVMSVLDREYLGMGQEVQRFEKDLSDFFTRPVTCVVNGTAALQLALQACGIGFGDEVVLPSLTYVASFQAVSAIGATPIACDVDEKTYVLDWCDAEKRLTSRTKAIMPVHYSGGVGDLVGVYDFAKKHNLRVIEDAAHAFGSLYRGKRVGSFGDIVCFSFDGIKNITSGEGGCIVTDDLKILKKIQDARLLGVERDSEKRYKGERSWSFDVTAQGWRYHMSNIMAAIGIEQLKRFSELSARRQSLARYYDDLLKGHPLIKTIPHDFTSIVPHIYVIQIKKGNNRDCIQAKLLEDGIETGIHYQPNHELSFYYHENIQPLPITDSISKQILTLPLHPDLKQEDVERVCESLKKNLREF